MPNWRHFERIRSGYETKNLQKLFIILKNWSIFKFLLLIKPMETILTTISFQYVLYWSLLVKAMKISSKYATFQKTNTTKVTKINYLQVSSSKKICRIIDGPQPKFFCGRLESCRNVSVKFKKIAQIGKDICSALK